jgi:hypothetical protein
VIEFLLTAVIVLSIAVIMWAALEMRQASWGERVCMAIVVASVVALAMLLTTHFAHARDDGQWEKSDPAIREWYQGLMMPDIPKASCCAEADAYWCDRVNVRKGATYCTITDDRPDAPLGRPHIENGTEVEIPNHKLKWDRGNPTGHNVVFLSREKFVYCFVQGAGI